MRVFAAAEPEALVHQLTALPAGPDPRELETSLELTNRLTGTPGLESVAPRIDDASASEQEWVPQEVLA